MILVLDVSVWPTSRTLSSNSRMVLRQEACLRQGPMLVDEAVELSKLLSNMNSNCVLLVMMPMHGVHEKRQILKNRRSMEDKLMQILSSVQSMSTAPCRLSVLHVGAH